MKIGGGMYRNITPVKKQNMIGSHGTKNFYFHVDNPTYLLKPEYKECSLNSPEILVILGLRSNPMAITSLLAIDEVIKNLDKTTIDNLKKPIYTVRTPDSFDKKHEIKNIPILYSYGTEYFTRFDYHNVSSCKEEGIKALSNFIDAISMSKKIEICIDKGTMIIFKNQKILHARNEFTTNYDGYDRWLLRAYAMMSIKSLCHKQIILDER